MGKSVFRKAVSMTALFSFLYMAFSGIVMYVTPAGRVAYWADWRMFGMNKTMYNQTHVTISLLFLVAMVLHIWLNWRPIVHYMKNRSGKLVIFTKETVFGLILSVVFVAGTLMMTPPFSNIVDFFDDVKEDYEYSLGNPPYPHAELTTLGAFIARMKFDSEQAAQVLDREGVTYTMEQTLKAIAEANHTDPARIYDLLKPTKIKEVEEPAKAETKQENGLDMSKYEALQGSGMGKKSIDDICDREGIALETALERLAKYGIKADKNETLREISGRTGVTPINIFIIIDSGIKPE